MDEVIPSLAKSTMARHDSRTEAAEPDLEIGRVSSMFVCACETRYRVPCILDEPQNHRLEMRRGKEVAVVHGIALKVRSARGCIDTDALGEGHVYKQRHGKVVDALHGHRDCLALLAYQDSPGVGVPQHERYAVAALSNAIIYGPV